MGHYFMRSDKDLRYCSYAFYFTLIIIFGIERNLLKESNKLTDLLKGVALN
jgi:hypothetical protein